MGNNNKDSIWKECGVCVSKVKRNTVYRTEKGEIHTVADISTVA